MLKPSIEVQRQTLDDIHKSQALKLMQTGIAKVAFNKRSDETYYGVPGSPESIPVVMMDGSEPSTKRVYVFLKEGYSKEGILQGKEVNIGEIHNPGTSTELVVPDDDFSLEQVNIVRSFVDELYNRRGADLPNLSDDLLGIVDRK